MYRLLRVGHDLDIDAIGDSLILFVPLIRHYLSKQPFNSENERDFGLSDEPGSPVCLLMAAGVFRDWNRKCAGC